MIRLNFVLKQVMLVALLLLGIVDANAQTASLTLSDFSGGLNTKDSDFSLAVSQATELKNIRVDENTKGLTKRNKSVVYGTADATEPILGAHRLYLRDGSKVLIVNHGDEIEVGNDSTGVFTPILTVGSGDRRWKWLTWKNIAIGTDGYNQPVKYDGTSASATYLGAALALDAGSGAGPNGTYSYKTTCYTASYEVSLGVASNELTVSDNDINLSMIPICPDTILGEAVIGRKIYRPTDGDTAYKLLSNGTIADNSTVTLTDSDADGALGAALSPDYTYTPPKGRIPVIHKNRLWLANNPDNPSTIYYSEDASEDFFLPISLFNVRRDDGDEITCADNVLGRLTICKSNTIQKIYTNGDTPTTDWEISDPFSSVGNRAIYSSVNTPYGLMSLGANGIYIFNGQNATLVSDQVTPEIRDIQPSNYGSVWSAYYKNKYYMAYTSIETGSSTNDKVLIYDTLTKAYSIDTLPVNAFVVFNAGTDIESLYSGGSNAGIVRGYSQTVNEVIHKKHSDFTGTFDDMRYIPTRWGGDADDPVFELAWTATIDSVVGTIDSVSGIIDRPDTDGFYESQSLFIDANELDKVYWNETIPSGGGDVTFAVRTASSEAGLTSASWSGEFTNPTGSDISGETANDWIQYRATMTTVNIAQTPLLTKENNYVVRLTYNKTGATDETSVDFEYKSGWFDFGIPARKKQLRKLDVYYESEGTGEFTIKFDTYEGSSDTFPIDLTQNPKQYSNYFTGQSLLGTVFQITITESSLNAFKINKIVITYDTEPYV